MSVSVCRDQVVNSTSDEGGGEGVAVAVLIATSLLSLVIVVGNGLIIVSVAVVKKLRQPANYLIVSLALSDFLVGLVVLPMTIVYDIMGEWVFGSMMCDVYVSFDVICCTASIMNLCMISIDRYMMITRPMKYPKNRGGKLMAGMIGFAWIISAAIIIPALFGFTENVKDSPHWIHPTKFVEEEVLTNQSFHSDSVNDIPLSKTGNLSRKYLHDHFRTFDLEVDHRITRFRYRDANASEALHIKLQGITCDERNIEFQKVRYDDSVFPQAHWESVPLDDNVKARYVRITLNISDDDFLRKDKFEIFVEKLRGKTCLISQEVWFSIYSTLGAFYIPLVVMLCMYWMIYLEASKFRPRNNGQTSTECSQEQFDSPGRTTNQRLFEKLHYSDPFLSQDTKNINNNVTTKGVSFQFPHSNSHEDVVGTNEKHCSQYSNNTDTSPRTFSDSCHGNDDVTGEDDTLSSVFDCCECLDSESHCNTSTGVGCDLSFLQNIKETVIGDYEGSEIETTLHPDDGVHQHQKHDLIVSLSSPDSTPHRTDTSPGWKTYCSCNRKPNTSLMGRSFKLNNGTCFPTISENNVLEIDHGNSSSSDNQDVFNRSPPQSRSCDLYKTSPTSHRTRPRNEPRHSIFSDTSLYDTKPSSRNNASNNRDYTNGSAKSLVNRRQSVGMRRLSVFTRYGHIGLNGIRKCFDKKATVLKNIRRRVSLTPSRERMRNVKATRTLGVIVGVFTFCWLPFFTVTFVRPFVCENPESQDCIPLLLVRIVLWLGYLNSALNPLIYIGFSTDLRKSFHYLLSCKCTNVDRRLAQNELRHAITLEKQHKIASQRLETESIM